jgi:predicted dehydrogenase
MLNNLQNLATRPFKVGIIGLGRQSLNDHIPALLRRDDIEIVSISDISEAAHKAFFEMYPALRGRVKSHKNFKKNR